MKLVYSNFDKETGISTVILQNRNGRYIGTARLHPEDKGSEIAGCSLAEKRAWINYYKSEIKRDKIKLKEILSIKKDIIINDSYYENPALIRINIRIKYLSNQIKTFTERLDKIQNYIDQSIKIRKNILDKLGQK